MTFQYFRPSHPRNVGAWVTVVIHNSKDGLEASRALELAILRPCAWNIGWDIVPNLRLFTFILLCFGIVFCWRRCGIRQD